MSFASTISNAKGVAADGRLHNVRTRHVNLASLFRAIQGAHEALLDATLASFPSLSRTFVKLALSQVMSDIQFEAGQQDEAQVNKYNLSMTTSRSTHVHTSTVPIGNIAILAYRIQSNPVAAVFGPLVAAISAGCPCTIFADAGLFSSQLAQLVKSALDKEAYAFVVGPGPSVDVLKTSFDKVVAYSKTESPNVIHIPNIKSNFVVLDQSLVPESVYRTKGRNPSSLDLSRLAAAAEVIREAAEIAPLAVILVSENIEPFVADLLQSSRITRTKLACPIIPCRSTEHIIAELAKREVDDGSLYIFAHLRQASYLSRYMRHRSCAINCMPLELLTGYVPPPSSSPVQFKKTQGSSSSNSLEPLWSSSLFSYHSSTISVPANRIKASKSHRDGVWQQVIVAPVPSMRRKKPKHLDFFPMGFKITAFPTLLTMLGLTGFALFKTGLFVFGQFQPFLRDLPLTS